MRNTKEEWDRERSYLDRHSLFEGAVDEPGEVILKELKIQDSELGTYILNSSL